MIIIGHTQNNEAHKTCFTALMTNFLKCPDSVTVGLTTENLSGFVSQAVIVYDLSVSSIPQYLYSLPEISGITVQYIRWGARTPQELNHLHEIRPFQYPALWQKSSLMSYVWKPISAMKGKNHALVYLNYDNVLIMTY